MKINYLTMICGRWWFPKAITAMDSNNKAISIRKRRQLIVSFFLQTISFSRRININLLVVKVHREIGV